jgi:biopolymer transport protein ExbB
MHAALETYAFSSDELRGAVHEMARHEAPRLQRHLGLLGTVASIAPMLGLLGTVSGMVQVFGKISVAGVGQATQLAGGIYEALFTTLFGLIVAIPSLVAYNHFGEKTATVLVDMEREALRAARTLKARLAAKTTAE